MFLNKPLVISGATASGKSELALALAQEVGLGIVSADSMQVYKHLDIASAKPTKFEQALVPHAGIDLVEPTENFSVAHWHTAIEPLFQCKDAYKWIVVGGSGLYIHAFLHGLDKLPESPPELRQKWDEVGLQVAAAELKNRDRELAECIDLQNPRRVVRALVLMDMGIRPPREIWQRPVREALHIHLVREPADLRGRIEARVRSMFQQGLMEEFVGLLNMGLAPNHTAWQAIGMDSLLEHKNGLLSFENTVNKITQRTWQFSRRQRTWFKKSSPIFRLNIKNEQPTSKILMAVKEIIYSQLK